MSKTVGVVIPSGDLIFADTAMCLSMMTSHCLQNGIGLAMINPKSSIVQKGRRIGVDMAIEYKVDYLFFLDSDMIVPADVIARLLAHKKRIVGAAYPMRVKPFHICAHDNNGERVSLEDKTGIGKVDRMPTGCLLINMDVFREVKRPWFRVDWDDTKGEERGEDYYFCDEAKKAGIQPWCDFDLSKQVGHLGTHMATWKGLV